MKAKTSGVGSRNSIEGNGVMNCEQGRIMVMERRMGSSRVMYANLEVGWTIFFSDYYRIIMTYGPRLEKTAEEWEVIWYEILMRGSECVFIGVCLRTGRWRDKWCGWWAWDGWSEN